MEVFPVEINSKESNKVVRNGYILRKKEKTKKVEISKEGDSLKRISLKR